MISVEHYVACQEALAPLFPKIQLGCNLADFRMEALTLLERAGIRKKDMLSHWENMEPLWDYLSALASRGSPRAPSPGRSPRPTSRAAATGSLSACLCPFFGILSV